MMLFWKLRQLGSGLHSKDWKVREASADALIKIGSAAVASLVSALGDKDQSVQKVAAKALGQIRDPTAVDALAVTLRDVVRRGAVLAGLEEELIKALAGIGDLRAIEVVVGALRVERVRSAATASLVSLGSAAVASLAGALADKAEDVRLAAVKALGEIRDSRVSNLLAAALQDERYTIRDAAAAAIIKKIGRAHV